jgi:hypothetical protein
VRLSNKRPLNRFTRMYGEIKIVSSKPTLAHPSRRVSISNLPVVVPDIRLRSCEIDVLLTTV